MLDVRGKAIDYLGITVFGLPEGESSPGCFPPYSYLFRCRTVVLVSEAIGRRSCGTGAEKTRVLFVIQARQNTPLSALRPYQQEIEDDYGGYMVQVMSGGSVEFTGEFYGTELKNMRSVFFNEEGGSIE